MKARSLVLEHIRQRVHKTWGLGDLITEVPHAALYCS